MSDSLPTHFVFSPRCLFCNKNSRPRNSKKGRYWKCRHCGELNPGPGMLKAMMGRFTTPPATQPNGHAVELAPAVAAAAPSTGAVVKIKGAAAPAAVAVVAVKKPAPRPPAAVARAKPASVPPAKRAGFLERVMYGN